MWSPLVPLLDEALLKLHEPERQAVILHFMEGRTFQEVGSALGIGEDAARKRVNRCLDQLTDFFRRRGFAVPTLAAGVPLFALSSHAAPAGLSAAYQPIGAVFISEKVYRTIVEGSRKYGTFGTGFTYSGHPVPAAVALATLRIYEEDHIEEHVRSIIPHFQERLRRLSEKSMVGEARGVGLVGAVELVKDKTSKTTFDPGRKVATWVTDKAFEHGLIVRALPNDTVAVCPPL